MVRAPEPSSPFHAGEIEVQSRVGVRDAVAPWARQVIRPVLPEQHRAFYAALPFVVAAARDEHGRPWATVLAGEPGLLRSPSPTRLHVQAAPGPGDPLAHALRPGADLGLLGIDLATRRRNRVNGRVGPGGEDSIVLEVAQTFGNCPQHIRGRAWRVGSHEVPPPPRVGSRLSDDQRQRLRQADTLFLASGHRGPGDHEAFGMDASHRGGPVGFVQVPDDRTVVLPDYAGNDLFNTLGNLVADPRVGVLLVDFATGGLLHLSGTARIDWDSPRIATFPGARRLVEITVEAVVDRPAALPLRWTDEGAAIRSLRLVERVPESDGVVSLVFESRDGGPLPSFEAGQHLPLELHPPGLAAPIVRTYSLSSGPSTARYRVTVARHERGLASRLLHAMPLGTMVAAEAPRGSFVVQAGARPLVLLGAGVGVTPLVSMLHALVEAGDRRSVTFVHAARDGRHEPLRDEIRRLVAAHADARRHVFYSRPQPGDPDDDGVHVHGRLHADALAVRLPSPHVDVYLCGPASFMAAQQAVLVALGVDPARIHTESFGAGG